MPLEGYLLTRSSILMPRGLGKPFQAAATRVNHGLRSINPKVKRREFLRTDVCVCVVMNLFHNVLNDEIYILRGGKYVYYLIQVQINEPLQSSVS